MVNYPHRWLSPLVVLVTALFSIGALGQTKSPQSKTSSGIPKVNYKEVKLKNGLRVFLVEDHTAPVISLALIYDVGSRDEKKGRTGFAHLFEHMMFQGSENIGKAEHFLLVDNNGGTTNGTTNKARTLYFENLPSNQLDLLLFLEADRMKGLDISQANLDNQRHAVQEERRLRLDNQPYGKMFEQFEETMFDNFAFKHSVIGSMDDLSAATVEDVKGFFQIYYAPNNAVLTLVGDFKTEEALEKIRKNFESIPSQSPPPQVDFSEVEQKTERRFTIEDNLAQMPMITIGYKNNTNDSPDAYVLQVLSSVLTTGQSSRLYQKLVKEKQLTISVSSFFSMRKGPTAYQFSATVNKNKSVEEVEAAIYEEIEKLKKQPIEDWELNKAREFAKRSAINSRQTSLGLAINMTEGIVAWNDPDYTNTRLDKIMAVTKEDIQRVAQKYFDSSTRTVGIAIPKTKSTATDSGNKVKESK